MATLAEIRAKLNQSENKKQASDNTPSPTFPFWDGAIDGTPTVIRFLPDGDTTNTFFWVEKQTIKITFDTTDDKQQKTSVNIPCLLSYGEERCPFKDRASEEFKRDAAQAKTLGIWPKKSYISQGLVISTDIKEEKTPESPIRIFVLNGSIYNILKNAIMDPDMENSPTDYDHGRDFRIKKTSKGGYGDYTPSGFVMKERALTKAERDTVEKWGLFDLKTRLPARPTQAQIDAYLEIMNAHIQGESFDTGRWGRFL